MVRAKRGSENEQESSVPRASEFLRLSGHRCILKAFLLAIFGAIALQRNMAPADIWRDAWKTSLQSRLESVLGQTRGKTRQFLETTSQVFCLRRPLVAALLSKSGTPAKARMDGEA
jgi:hypothetical protein